MTRARTAIQSILRDADEPLSAASVFRSLAGAFDQATVYRTLHYLEGKGFADSFVLHCAEHGTERYFTARSEASRESHRHWFHCESCHRFTDLGDCQLSAMLDLFESRHGVAIRDHSLNLTGLCAECRSREAD